jgi:hypothetical protein
MAGVFYVCTVEYTYTTTYRGGGKRGEPVSPGTEKNSVIIFPSNSCTKIPGLIRTL